MRQLHKKFRLVFTGDSRGTHDCWAEYRVADGDMSEPHAKLEFEDLDEMKTVDEVWQEAIGALKEHEGI